MLGLGVKLAGAFVVKLTEGVNAPPVPVDETMAVLPKKEALSALDIGGIPTVEFEDVDGKAPLSTRTEEMVTAPELAKTPVPLKKELFRLGVKVTLADAGSDTLADGATGTPDDAVSITSEFSGVSSGI